MIETGNYVAVAKKRVDGTRLSDRSYLDCLQAHSGVGEDAAMVLDDSAEVLFCNNAAAVVFATTPRELTGRHISEFVLDTRLSRTSPGSNVAYAAYSGRRNEWREYCVCDADGKSFPQELLFDVAVVNLRYLIMLWIRMPSR